MPDPVLPPDPAIPPEIAVLPARRAWWQRISIIWLVPVAAMVVALGIAWQNYTNRGPLIEITFADAAGIIPRETQLRFRDVGVGLVEQIAFAEDLARVVVSVRLEPEVAPYVDNDAEFWVVRPEVSTQGITGLETVLSGVYIKGQWDPEPEGLRRRFEALDTAPLLSADEVGTIITLRASDGSLQGNVPLLYKGVQVGRVGPAVVNPDGQTVEAQAVILAPWNDLVTEATRFFNISGFSLNIGAGGASLDFASASTLIVGGISFETWVSGAPLVGDEGSYLVYPSESIARANVFNRVDGQPLQLSATFEGNVSGLAVGAPVEIDGLVIGEVTGLTGIVDRQAFGDGRVRLWTQLSIQPARLGFDGEEAPDLALAVLQDQVRLGLRARLVTGSLLNGGLKVQLTQIEDAPPATINMAAQPYPALPTTRSDISDIQSTAQGTLDRIGALPIEELLDSANTLLAGASAFVNNRDLQESPAALREILASAAGIASAPTVQSLPERIDGLVGDLEATLAEARSLVASLTEADAAARLLATVDSTGAAVEEARAAIARLPDVMANLETLSANAAALPLDALAGEAQGLMADGRALLADEALQGLGAQVSATLARVDNVVAEVQSGGLATRISEAVNGIADAANAVSDVARDISSLTPRADTTLASIDEATRGLPVLIDNANRVTANLAEADMQALAGEAAELFDRIAAYLDGEDMQAVPGELNRLLASATAVVAEIERAGVAQSLNTTMQSVQGAANRIASASDGLPALVAQARDVLGGANTAVSGLSDMGQTMRDVRTALREISTAAQGVASLARRLERAPNSLIFGN